MRQSNLIWVVLAVLIAGPLAAADTYKIDGVHSTAIFRIKHMNTSYSYGRFNDISGKIVNDAANPAAGSVEIEIKADSIDTHNANRDGHLKSPDFLNTKQFPVITFKSKEIKKAGDALEVSGDFTLHGVTKPVTTKVVQTGTGKNPKGGELIGFETTFTIKRSDYGMNFMPGGLGDVVQITFASEAVK